ncbi:39S ribosomal protein L16, mitochondrial-like [Pollicipes pollicipes]|uniref:39S ribosomal protein L16, mitochondrial-like n=1 Tax=Pollicipes pollicipes TaxID=41117 RepID=UPI0018856FFF|nr:39S ribosomal protein L16, mitochondrial-like [Pollicipes pollicipes]
MDVRRILRCSGVLSNADHVASLFVRSVPVAGLKYFKPPADYSDMKIPERPKLWMLPKVPQFPPGMRIPKSQKRLIDMRGPETVHNQLLHKQYGIIALTGGKLKHGHMEMIRMTLGRRIDVKRMFAVWRVDAVWKPVTKRGQGKRMGGGKGAIDHYVSPVRAGRVIVELAGACDFEECKPALQEVAGKLPFKAEVVSHEILQKKQELERWQEANNNNPYTYEYLVQNNMTGCHRWCSKYDKIWFGKYQ